MATLEEGSRDGDRSRGARVKGRGSAGPWPWWVGLAARLREATVAWAGCYEQAELRLLSFFSFLPKTENVKEEKGEERKVEIEFGHGDKFHGLTKMSLIQENRKGQG